MYLERFEYDSAVVRGKFNSLYRPEKTTSKERQLINRAIKAFNSSLINYAKNTPEIRLFIKIATTYLLDLYDFSKAPPFSDQHNHYRWLKYKTDAARFTLAHTYPQLELAGIDSGWVSRLIKELGLAFDPSNHNLKSSLIRKYGKMKAYEIQGLASKFKI